MVEVQLLLQWCRANDFRVHEVQSGTVRVLVEDIRTMRVGALPKLPGVADEPQDIHEAWADQLGVPRPAQPETETPEDEGEP